MDSAKSIVLDNLYMSVELSGDRPFPVSYRCKPGRMEFGGARSDALLAVNGTPVPWRDWEVVAETGALPGMLSYRLRSIPDEYLLRFSYELHDRVLSLEVTVLSDSRCHIRTIEWINAPLLTCGEPGVTVWRETWKQRSWDEEIGRGLWASDVEEKPLAELLPDPELTPHFYSCLYHPEKVCAAVLSSGRYMPLRNQVLEETGRKLYAISPGPYQHRARKLILEPLKLNVAFLTDINGDGRTDASDFQLWANRQLPDPWPTHRDAIWYKIYCGDPGGTNTTFAQAEEIIERVNRYTDGLPQIAYLVGWQYDGHDTGYPSIDKVNAKLGGRERLWNLHKRAKEELNTTVSYHINIDDSYMSHPGWDESVIGREPDGSLMKWERFNDEQSYHIVHTKDVESGKVFTKLEALMREVPLEGSIHLDAFRNTNWSWEPDGFIGAVEELECGVKPIINFFRSRGIDVTIESQNMEWCGLVSGVLHVSRPLDMVQLRHGKLLTGGRGWPSSLWYWGLGSSINWDVIYTENGEDFYTRGAWNQLLDGIYLGTLLYHFYLEREMTIANIGDEAAELRFSDGVTVFARRDNTRLLVTQGDVVIADDYDRFIPRGCSIYAYSRDGSNRAWVLPHAFRGRKVEIRTLGDSGGQVRTLVAGERLDLGLAPRVPVKISLVQQTPD